MSPLDLHVLGTPPAFVLSQDQTLMFNPLSTLLDYFRNPKQKTHFQNQLSNFFLRFFLLSVSFSRFVPVRSAVFSAARRSLYIIPNLYPFVNTFFKKI